MNRRRPLRIAGITVVLFFAVHLGSCRMYDAFVVPVEADGLIRERVETPSGWIVSALSPVSFSADAQRVIYVHGTPGDATSLEHFLLDPVADLAPMAIDRPGFGHSRPRAPARTLREQAQALEPFLVEQGGRYPILVGHSFGGAVVARTAAEYPDRVGGLVIVSGSLDPDLERPFWFNRLGEFGFVPYMIPRFLRNSNRELLPLKEELEKLKPLLDRISCPVVIVHAENDMLVPFDNVGYMQRSFPAGTIAEVIRLEDKNHFIPWNAPDVIRAAVETLAQHTPAYND